MNLILKNMTLAAECFLILKCMFNKFTMHWLFPGTVIWYQLHRIVMVTAVILSSLAGIVVMVEIKGFTKVQVSPVLNIP